MLVPRRCASLWSWIFLAECLSFPLSNFGKRRRHSVVFITQCMLEFLSGNALDFESVNLLTSSSWDSPWSQKAGIATSEEIGISAGQILSSKVSTQIPSRSSQVAIEFNGLTADLSRLQKNVNWMSWLHIHKLILESDEPMSYKFWKIQLT